MGSKSTFLIVSGFLLMVNTLSFGQNGFTENFNDNSLAAGWAPTPTYGLTESNEELTVTVINLPVNSFRVFSFNFTAQDISQYPYLTLSIKTSQQVSIRVDLEDGSGRVTNANPIINTSNPNYDYQTFTFNFTGRFTQSWPTNATVDPTNIVRLVFFVNPGGLAFSNNFTLDNLLFGDATGITPPPENSKLNQLGFYPSGPKNAAVVSSTVNPFYIVSEDKEDTLFTGILGSARNFALTGETVRLADFSNFKTIGRYFLLVPTIGYSYPFEIKPNVHLASSKASIKSFYYQRSSMELTSAFAGPWARAMGHPDEEVVIHASAASPFRPAGTVISSPRGWYDAGDFNKYIITAGISTSLFLSMYEQYPSMFDTLSINIPESSNTLPDILDEALWEIRWMLTMQDPSDGGVYHKLTSPDFDGSVMPSESTQIRYVVKKSTTSSLDFAATLAQAARIFKLFENQLPGLADSCLNASAKAWNWARKNRTDYYVQNQLVPNDINTGEYGDNNALDEFQWAAMELYATTKLDSFYTAYNILTNISPPSWQNVRSLGYLSLAHLRKQLTPIADTSGIKQRIINQAEYLKNNAAINPYGTSMHDPWNFIWGSNSIAASQGVFLLNAFNITKDSAYLKVAVANLDYILGRNGNNYCYVTGQGSRSPMDIHHRISSSDNLVDPVPGLLAGGPNIDAQNDCGGPGAYPSLLAGKSYLDAYCSYSTNEVAINWNAPLSYLGIALEAIFNGLSTEQLDYENLVLSNRKKSSTTSLLESLSIYPNPAKEVLYVSGNNPFNESITLSITDVQGIRYMQKIISTTGNISESIDISGIKKGMYFLVLTSTEKTEAKKIIID